MPIVGTAGHVDHGKSSLVRALTGTDPDRLAEEQRRGMTIDLGFARLAFDDGVEAGIIDVPGHERFLRTMLAGASSMDVVLLAIAATEGVRAQTLEHLTILHYLDVRRVLVVLTMCDRVSDAERLDAIARARDALQGTLADGAPVFCVSSFTGAGIDALRAALHDAVLSVPPQSPDAPAYLPVDRVFTLPGHGTIVTGTLMQGRIATGDLLAITPPGHDVRVRGLHVFGQARDAVGGGTRVAVNLSSFDADGVRRGAVLAARELTPAGEFAIAFRPDRPAERSIKRRTPVRVSIGAAEIIGTLVLDTLAAPEAIVPARLTLRQRAIALPGAPLVLRAMNPARIIGGARIGTAQRRDDAMLTGDAAGIAEAVRAAGVSGRDAASIATAANVRIERTHEILALLLHAGRVIALSKPAAFVDAELAADVAARTTNVLRAAQRRRPWSLGMRADALARACDISAQRPERLFAAFVARGTLAHVAGHYTTPDHVPQPNAEQHAFFALVVPVGPTAPADASEVVRAIASTPIDGLADAYDMLLASKRFVKVGDHVYRAERIDEIKAAVVQATAGGASFTVAEFRTLTGSSRKYAVPLLEYLDADGFTLRAGDVRIVRGGYAARPSSASSSANHV